MSQRLLMVSLVGITFGCSGFSVGCGAEPESTSMEFREVAAFQIDPSVQPTATEFTRRLVTNGGQLLGLSLTGGTLEARWNSGKCDYFEPELIDLLISVNRTIKESPSIVGARECGGDTRIFKIDGKRFQQFRTGKITDSQVFAEAK